MRISIVIGCIFLFFSTAAWGEMVVVVNDSLPVTELSQEDAAKIFLGKDVKWGNNESIAVAILVSGKAHQEFLSNVVEKRASQFLSHWKKLVFSGTGQAPKTFNLESELADYVAKNPGAVGYLDSRTPHPGAKQVIIKQ